MKHIIPTKLTPLALALLLTTGCVSLPDDGPGTVRGEPIFGEEIDTLVADGDIVLRNEGDAESQLIADLTGSPWSHAGMIVRTGAETLVVHNYPSDSGTSSIQYTTIDDFFAHAATGGIWRFTGDASVPGSASAWAQAQVGDPAYIFNLFDPYENGDKQQYCSEFVWRAYLAGGADLVPTPLDLKGTSEARTRRILHEFLDDLDLNALQKKVAADKVDDLVDHHPGKYIAPGQLDTSALTAQER